ncbi:TraI/MobA(P) family conjugative relaxase [Thalassospira alkalitolerans]|uniref:TraI/MobA(P) family conjugative relaxase n=1 Tax=Thalassospira alkalitolerans TaxID=1293890 RepID=UPI003AA8705F
MIAKKIPKKPDVADNFKALAEYIAAAKEPGEKLDKFWISNCGSGETLDDLELALREVYAVRRMKPEITDKSYHMIVSFRPGEKDQLSEKDLKEIASAYAKGLGYAEHQYVAGTHINTDNFHMHIAFNKIHPRTLQVVTPYRDYKVLDRVSRKLEKEYGLFIDKGMSQSGNHGPKLSPSARDYEAQTWQESFQNHVLQHRKEVLGHINGAETWQDLHKTLAEYDLTLKKRGNGFVLVGPDGQGMKASALDRKVSKTALEKKLGSFTPPIAEDGEKKSPSPKRRYKKRPNMRHPAMSPIWRRYLNLQKPMHTRRTFFQRTISNWKLFLLSEAYKDPMAMVFLIAQQEFLHMVFGDDKPTPVSKLAAPALAAWREAGQWASAKSLNWLAASRSTGRGCRIDDKGNLIVPLKDANGYMQRVSIYAPDGKRMQIGNVKARGLTHLIDSRKQSDRGPVIFTDDYVDAVKIHDATRRPVVFVPDAKDLRKTITEHRHRNPMVKPIVATKTPITLPNVRSVTMPNDDDLTKLRRTFAHAVNDQAFLVWDECEQWATRGNSNWLKTNGLRGYGVKITKSGDVAVPLKDRSGRIENVILIDDIGRQDLVQSTEPAHPCYHMIDPQWREEKDTIVVALNYADAAAIHRATRCPVVVPADAHSWAETTEQIRLRNNDVNIIIALDASGQQDDVAKAEKLAVDIVRPALATSFKEYAKHEPTRSGARLLDFGHDHFDFDPDKSNSSYAKLQDVNGSERYVWGVDVADVVSQSGAQTGDWISLEISERKEVVVKEPYRDENGTLQTRQVVTHRNIWKAEILPDPETTPSLTALRSEMANMVGDDGWLAWQSAIRPDTDNISSRPKMGTERAWSGFRVDGEGNTLIPLRDGGNRLSGVYRVSPSGSVETLAGTGGIKGAHHIVGGRISKDPTEPILIADDLTSAIELNRHTRKPVVWAVNSENLKAVGENIRRYNPDREILFAAMDAHMAKENIPLDLAREAAQAIKVEVLVPPLSEHDKKRNSMSFGDLLKGSDRSKVSDTLRSVGIKQKQKDTKPTQKVGRSIK